MTLNHEQLIDIIERLSRKIGISNDEPITIDQLTKKIMNQNLFYSGNSKEVNFLTPSFTNAFLLKSSEFLFKDEVNLKNVDKNLITSVKMINNKELFVKDLNGNKVTVPFNGDNVSIFFKHGIPFDVALQLLS